jgi:hypothetical protein
MNRIDLLFSTDKFNRTEVKEHFINPCCFGEDLAQWLVDRLRSSGIQVSDIGQEDWGWYFTFEKYFVGVGADASGEEPEQSNFGEWRVMIERRRSLSELFRKVKIDVDDPVVKAVVNILKSDPAFSDVRFE